ncbi:MAG: type II secretion system protein [bacterium]|nr:type II secretion system protein [bacterium]
MFRILFGNNILQKLKKENGFIFLEILIAVALVGIVFLTLLSIGVQSMAASRSIKKAAEVDSLIKEELEAVRSFRDGTQWATNGLGVVATGSTNPRYTALDSSTPPKWILQSGTETVGAFTRNVVFDKVSRNPSTQNIESTYNAANDDPDTRKATVTVTYGGKTYQVITYLTNWQNN